MNQSEINQLYGPLYQECIFFARTLTREEQGAQDWVQDACYLAHKHRHSYEEGTNLRQWIKTIVSNTFLTSSTALVTGATSGIG